MSTKKTSPKKEIKKQIKTLCHAFNPRIATKADWFAFEDKLNPLLDQLFCADPSDKTHVVTSGKPIGTCVGADSNEDCGRYETEDTGPQTRSYERRWVSPLTEYYAYCVKRSEPKPKSLMQQERELRLARAYRPVGNDYEERVCGRSDSLGG